MKIFKLLFWALILVPVLSFTSCSDDDDVNYKPQITANKWVQGDITANAANILGTIEALNEEQNLSLKNQLIYRLTNVQPFGDKGMIFEFKANNDLYVFNEKIGTYELNNSELVIDYAYSDFKSKLKYHVSFSGKNLVLTLDYASAISLIEPEMAETPAELKTAIKTALKTYSYKVEFTPHEEEVAQ